MEFRSELTLLGKLQKHNFLAFNLKALKLIFSVFSFAYPGSLLHLQCKRLPVILVLLDQGDMPYPNPVQASKPKIVAAKEQLEFYVESVWLY